MSTTGIISRDVATKFVYKLIFKLVKISLWITLVLRVSVLKQRNRDGTPMSYSSFHKIIPDVFAFIFSVSQFSIGSNERYTEGNS
jgi:hypothetical protein